MLNIIIIVLIALIAIIEGIVIFRLQNKVIRLQKDVEQNEDTFNEQLQSIEFDRDELKSDCDTLLEIIDKLHAMEAERDAILTITENLAKTLYDIGGKIDKCTADVSYWNHVTSCGKQIAIYVPAYTKIFSSNDEVLKYIRFLSAKVADERIHRLNNPE